MPRRNWRDGRPVAGAGTGAGRGEGQASELHAQNSGLHARLQAQKEQVEQQAKTLSDVRAELEREMKLLAQQALQSNQQSFIAMANQVFEKHRVAAAGDLNQKKDSIAALLKPLGETVQRYQKSSARFTATSARR